MSEREDRLVRVILTLREGLTGIVEQLNDILKELAPEGTSEVPSFDSEELMGHKWKGKRAGACIGDGYTEGSLAWGWDFRDNFSPDIIKVLEKGPLQVDQYEFTLSERLVQTKKVK